ncbi:hypothetical protein Pelo_12570 [Pelomyxa schiedti]|nr:hypothetical protein Pelo_12570 [Pelomyxa schiedti]
MAAAAAAAAAAAPNIVVVAIAAARGTVTAPRSSSSSSSSSSTAARIPGAQPAHSHPLEPDTTHSGSSSKRGASSSSSTSGGGSRTTQATGSGVGPLNLASAPPQEFLESVHREVWRDIATMLAEEGGEELAVKLQDKIRIKLDAIRQAYVLAPEVVREVRSTSAPYSRRAAGNAIIYDLLDSEAQNVDKGVEDLRNWVARHQQEEERHLRQKELEEKTIKDLEERLAQAKLRLAEEKKLCEDFKMKRVEAEAMVHVQSAKAALLRADLAPTLTALKTALDERGSIETKARAKSLTEFSVPDIGILLRELGLVKHVQEFSRTETDGHVLDLMVRDDMCRENGVTELNERKALSHAVFLIKSTGKIRAPPPMDVSGSGFGVDNPVLQLPHFSPQQLVAWLENRDQADQTRAHASKFRDIPGFAFLHLNMKDLDEIIPGVPSVTVKIHFQDLIDKSRQRIMDAYLNVPDNLAAANVSPQWLCSLTGNIMESHHTTTLERDPLLPAMDQHNIENPSRELESRKLLLMKNPGKNRAKLRSHSESGSRAPFWMEPESTSAWYFPIDAHLNTLNHCLCASHKSLG